jgi:3D (Asp-Asp-Asp) domain-containing protein
VSALGMMVGAWSMLVQIVAPQASVEPPQGAHEAQSAYVATVSAYSCDANPANPMNPCGPFRDGTRPHNGLHGLVAAGPYEWLGETVHIEGYGDVLIRDTPRNAWYGDSPHIDVFMSYRGAINWGIQQRQIWKVE